MTPIQYLRVGILVLCVLCPFGFWGWHEEAGRFADFKAAQRAIAQAQEAQTKRIIAENRTAKETADAENKAATDKLRADVERLRKQRARTVYVPAAPADAVRTDLACFDRTALEQAIGRLADRVSAIAAEGDAATIDLNSAKRWAQRP